MSSKVTRLLLPLFCLIAGYLYWQQHQIIYEDKGRLNVYEANGSVVLEWHSSVRVPMAVRFSEAFEMWADTTSTFIIDLHSNGGALREGARVIELLNSMKQNHKIVTRVSAGNACLSMCVPIYLQGEERIASGDSRWMFHEPRAYDFFDGSEASQPEFEREYYNNRFFEKYFTNSVIEPEWREQLKRDWVGKDIWKTGRELVDEQTNIITRLE